MKINIVRNENGSLNGYENVVLTQHDASCLDYLCEDNECDEIICDDVIDFFDANQVDNVIRGWVGKLRHGAKFVFIGNDLSSIIRDFYCNRINISYANLLIYGSQNSKVEYNKSMLNRSVVIKELTDLGLKIVKNTSEEHKYIIEAKRP